RCNMTAETFSRASEGERHTLVCFSHLRWNFVYQRPQHLMSRFAREFQVLFMEEPVEAAEQRSWLQVREEDGIRVLVPHLAPGLTPAQSEHEQRRLLDAYLGARPDPNLVLW